MGGEVRSRGQTICRPPGPLRATSFHHPTGGPVQEDSTPDAVASLSLSPSSRKKDLSSLSLSLLFFPPSLSFVQLLRNLESPPPSLALSGREGERESVCPQSSLTGDGERERREASFSVQRPPSPPEKRKADEEEEELILRPPKEAFLLWVGGKGGSGPSQERERESPLLSSLPAESAWPSFLPTPPLKRERPKKPALSTATGAG